MGVKLYDNKLMTRQDEIAAKAVRISTLKSLKQKRALRIRQIKGNTDTF